MMCNYGTDLEMTTKLIGLWLCYLFFTMQHCLLPPLCQVQTVKRVLSETWPVLRRGQVLWAYLIVNFLLYDFCSIFYVTVIVWFLFYILCHSSTLSPVLSSIFYVTVVVWFLFYILCHSSTLSPVSSWEILLVGLCLRLCWEITGRLLWGSSVWSSLSVETSVSHSSKTYFVGYCLIFIHFFNMLYIHG